MKSHLIILTILIYSSSCRSDTNTNHQTSTDKTEITVTPIFKGFYYLGNHDDYGKFILFDIILSNNSKTPLEFWTLSAAPTVNIVTDPDKFDIFVPTFSVNQPVVIKLDRGQEFVVPVVLNRNDSIRLNALRFGFVILKPKYKIGFKKEHDLRINPRDELIEMSIKKENVIWSEMTEFHPLMNECRYQIRTIINDSTYSIISRERLFK